jgi:glycosyltransferase involved in cell wall biosynthesis
MPNAMGDTTISIIIPCYNGARTLSTAIESALAQADEGVELDVVVIDDGSTDNSLEQAKRWAHAVRVLTGPNRGVSAARNSGIAESAGEWVVFLDADDLMEPGSLARSLTVARSQNADVVICEWTVFDDDGSGILVDRARHAVDWPALDANLEVAIATHVWAPTAAILYKRTLVGRIGGFNRRLPIIQDARFMFDAAYHGGRFVRADHMGARYRVITSSLSRSNPERFAQDLLINTREIGELWRARGNLDDLHRGTLRDMLNIAGRALFAAGHPDYFTAVLMQRELGMTLPLHSRVAPVLARLLGLGGARRIITMLGRR